MRGWLAEKAKADEPTAKAIEESRKDSCSFPGTPLIPGSQEKLTQTRDGRWRLSLGWLLLPFGVSKCV